MALSESMLHRVVPSALPPELALEISQAASDTHGAMIDANSTWKGLDAYFVVQGAEGVYQMLERLVVDASNFSTAVFEGYSQLIQSEYTLYDLEQRRLRLIDDIADVNTRVSNARSSLSYEQGQASMVCYPAGSWAERQQEQNVWLAQREVLLAEHEEEKIRKKIDRFNTDVENREGDIARGLANIRGGSDVHDETGSPISRSKWDWGAPGASTTDLPMVERFERALTNQYITRLDWMLEQDGSTIDAWMLAHPGFAAAGSLVDPKRMSVWFERHVPRESISADWEPAGVWAKLHEHAPGAIGNLNGLPSVVRDSYNRAYLDDLLAELPNDSDAYGKLHQLSVQMDMRDSTAMLLSLFFDGEEPRAAVSMGNVDEADQIVVMTHGISNNLGSMPSWLRTANDMHLELGATEGTNTAIVTWFSWDSGGNGTVQHADNARTGAARFNADLDGWLASNAAAQQESGGSVTKPHVVASLHSYGTTMGGEAFIRNPEVFNAIFMNGSPGITDTAAETYAASGSSGTHTLYAALGDDDFTAGTLGLKIWNFDHRNNPVNIDGITEISVDGGDGYDRVTGHNAHQDDDGPGYFTPGTASYETLLAYLQEPIGEK